MVEGFLVFVLPLIWFVKVANTLIRIEFGFLKSGHGVFCPLHFTLTPSLLSKESRTCSSLEFTKKKTSRGRGRGSGAALQIILLNTFDKVQRPLPATDFHVVRGSHGVQRLLPATSFHVVEKFDTSKGGASSSLSRFTPRAALRSAET